MIGIQWSRINVSIFFVSIILISLILHKNVMNLDIQGIHSWRQSQTMLNVRNFTRYDSCILNPRVASYNADDCNIHRYEFPIMQWVFSLFQKAIGEDIIIIRLLCFSISLLALIFLYHLFKEMGISKEANLISCGIFFFSPLIFYYQVNPLPDNMAMSFSIGYIYFRLKFSNDEKGRCLILSTLSLLIATSCKLPFLMFSILSIYFFCVNVFNKKIQKGISIAIIELSIVLPSLIWYNWVMPSWTGNGILYGIFDNQIPINETLSIIRFHLCEMFPNIIMYKIMWVPFIIGGIVLVSSTFLRWVYPLIAITCLYLILQINMIHTGHDYYMMPFVPWIYILSALGVNKILTFKNIVFSIFIWTSFLLSPIWTYYETKHKWDIEYGYVNENLFKYQTELIDAVPENELCIILNDNTDYIFPYKIDKMGYIFKDDILPTSWIEDVIVNKGVKYMYSDSRTIDEKEDVQKFIDTLIVQKGDIKVFRLKK